MNQRKMTDKFDRTSTEHAHWRIDELQEVIGGMTEVVDSHSKDINSIKSVGRQMKTSIYTLAAVYVTSQVGLLEVIRKFIGI